MKTLAAQQAVWGANLVLDGPRRAGRAATQRLFRTWEGVLLESKAFQPRPLLAFMLERKLALVKAEEWRVGAERAPCCQLHCCLISSFSKFLFQSLTVDNSLSWAQHLLTAPMVYRAFVK